MINKNYKAMQPWAQGLGSFLAGGLLVLAFAPFQQFYCAWIAPALLYCLVRKTTPARACLLGWLFGLGQFGFGVSWVFISIHVYGYTPIPIAVVFTALLIMYLALFPALQCALLIKRFPSESSLRLLLVYPLTWVLFEIIRSSLLTGFPWLLIGYSQVNSPLRGFIPWLGEFGMAFIILFCSGLLIILFSRHRSFIHRSAALAGFLFILITGFLLAKIEWTQPAGKKVSVALVQGNIPQSIKWNPSSTLTTLKVYYSLTLPYLNNQIIVWPEAAIPLLQQEAEPFLKKLNDLTQSRGVSLLTGIPVEQSFKYYNAIIALGKGSGFYYKRHLVPFGEYVPFANLLRGSMAFFNLPMSDMAAGPLKQPDLKADNISLAPFICYEIAYANDLYRSAAKSNLLLTVSDDAWFGDSLAPWQHLEIGQFRALQSGRDLLFASNDGITAIVDHKGRIIKKLPQFYQGVLQGEVQPRTGMTPWMTMGNAPLTGIVVFLFLVLVIAEEKKRIKNQNNFE